MNFYPAFRDRVMMLRLGISLFFSSFFAVFLNKSYAIPPPSTHTDKYLDLSGGPSGAPGYVADDIGWRPDEDLYLHYSSGYYRHLSGDAAVRSVIYNYSSPYGWDLSHG